MLNAANNAVTVLAQAITGSATSFVVADASAFPAAPFRISIDAEIMEVGTIVKETNTFSNVTRGIENTIASNHDVGATVENRWTAGMYSEITTDFSTHKHTGNAGDAPKIPITSIDTDIATQEELNANIATTTAHINATTAHGSVSTATPNTIMQRDANGRAKVAAPAAADDIARKDTVDNAQTTVTNALNTHKTSGDHDGRYYTESESDAKYALKANPTITGALNINDTNTQLTEGTANVVRLQTPNGYVDVGAQNTSYAHIYTDRPAFYFNHDLYINGSKVWHQGNDGAGSGLDADTLQGASPSSFIKIATGSYSGTGGDTRTISLPFTPRIIFITTVGDSSLLFGIAINNGWMGKYQPSLSSVVTKEYQSLYTFYPTTNGFILNQGGGDAGGFNWYGKSYYYVALG